jgi:hypothetical protein
MAFDVASIGVLVLAFILLIANWMIGQQEYRTKCILTACYVLSWLLLFFGFWAVTLAQIVFVIVVGILTFGIDWLMGR